MSELDTSVVRKKRSGSEAVKRSPEDDHRRKRRNRTTQSCLNCHTSKRMCDRKRPCGRCTQLGLTGLCVYEVDDPSRSNDSPDEKTRLQKRVAELESVIRELKNKPHPRWVNSSGTASTDPSDKSPSNCASKSHSPRDTHPGLPQLKITLPPDSDDSQPPELSPSFALNGSPFLDCGSSSSSRSGFSTPSPLSVPSPLSPLSPSPIRTAADHSNGMSPDCDLISLFSICQTEQCGTESGVFDQFFDSFASADADQAAVETSHLIEHGCDVEHCGCLSDPASYGAVLELSLRLRKAASILGRHARHAGPSHCALNQSISELDRFTSNTLGNINSPIEPMHMDLRGAQHLTVTPPSTLLTTSQLNSQSSAPPSPLSISPLSTQSQAPWGGRSSSYPSPPSDDIFMSWEPLRQHPPWSAGGSA
ncbi:hypothetical protein CERSUDRAFT_94391 [Gelatoporia subvermispora B]|uniref:Zn(2)-C6 fungal-type domain-containing protein n=1 Tax=Ceriporiopsis subvermispora (strain B) TaxID=914234 RepID=M2PLX4_CERS8|nr:hypothetical protein CERSUDRAFT_94391 [Gelatoporia subvermispora B]